MADIKDYKRTLNDEIDWKIIDQLHTATVSFSSTSIELKKLFFVMTGIAVPSLIKLAGDKLDVSLFITLYFLTLTFWFLDSFTYFYQEKLREKMDKLFNQIKARHYNISTPEEFTIEIVRTNKDRFRRSILNSSVRLYLIVFILNTLSFIFFLYNII